MSWNSKTIDNTILAQWRKDQKRGYFPYYPIQVVTDKTFEQEDFRRVLFTTTFTKVTFNNCIFNYTDFGKATFSYCTFYGGNFNFTNFKGTSLTTCTFIDVDATECNIDCKTVMPKGYTWMSSIYYPEIDRVAQISLWKGYPIAADEKTRQDYVAMVELEYGHDL